MIFVLWWCFRQTAVRKVFRQSVVTFSISRWLLRHSWDLNIKISVFHYHIFTFTVSFLLYFFWNWRGFYLNYKMHVCCKTSSIRFFSTKARLIYKYWFFLCVVLHCTITTLEVGFNYFTVYRVTCGVSACPHAGFQFRSGEKHKVMANKSWIYIYKIAMRTGCKDI
jgi:hypothetical protein